MRNYTDDYLDMVESASPQDVTELYSYLGPDEATELRQKLADRRMNRGPSISAAPVPSAYQQELEAQRLQEEKDAITPLDLTPKQYPSLPERIQQEQIAAQSKSIPRQVAEAMVPAVGLAANPIVAGAAKSVLEPATDVLQSGVGRPAAEEVGKALVEYQPILAQQFPRGGIARHMLKAGAAPYTGQEYLAEDVEGRKKLEEAVGSKWASRAEAAAGLVGAAPLYEVAAAPLAGAGAVRRAGRLAGEAVAPLGEAVAAASAQAGARAQTPLTKLLSYYGVGAGYAAPTAAAVGTEAGIVGAALGGLTEATKREGDVGKGVAVGGAAGAGTGAVLGGYGAAKDLELGKATVGAVKQVVKGPKKPVTIFSPEETQAFHDELVTAYSATRAAAPQPSSGAPPQIESGLPENFRPGFATVDVAENGVPKIVLSEVGPNGLRQVEVSYSSPSETFSLLKEYNITKSLHMSSRLVQAADTSPDLAHIRDYVFNYLYARYQVRQPEPAEAPIRNTDKESTKSLLKRGASGQDVTKTVLPKITATPPQTVVDPKWGHPATGGHTMIVDTGDGLGPTFVRTPDNRGSGHLPDVGDFAHTSDGELTVVTELGPDAVTVLSIDGTSTRQIRAGDLTLVNTNDIPLFQEALSGAGGLAQFPKITPELVQGIYRTDPMSAHDLLMTLEHEGFVKPWGDAYVPTQRLAKLNTAHDAVTQAQKPVAVGAMRANELDAPTLDVMDVPVSKGDDVRVRSSGERGRVVGEDPASPGNVLVKVGGKTTSLSGAEIKVLGSKARKKRAPANVVTTPRDRNGVKLAVNDTAWIRPSKEPLAPLQGTVEGFTTKNGQVYATVEVRKKRITKDGDFVPGRSIRILASRLQRVPVMGEKIEPATPMPAVLTYDLAGLSQAMNLFQAGMKFNNKLPSDALADLAKRVFVPKQQWGDEAIRGLILRAYGAESVQLKEHDLADWVRRMLPDKRLLGPASQDLTKWGVGKMTEEEFFAKHPGIKADVRQRLRWMLERMRLRERQLMELEMITAFDVSKHTYGQDELAYLHRDYLAHTLNSKEYADALKNNKLPFDVWGKYETAVRFIREEELARTGRVTSDHDARNIADEILALRREGPLRLEEAIKAGRFGFLKHRQKLPGPIYDLLDPNVGGVIRWTRTFVQQEFAYQRGLVMRDIRQNPEWWSIGPTDTHTYHVPMDRKYGMARGGWVPDEVGEALFTPLWQGPKADSPALQMVLDLADTGRGVRAFNLTIGQGPRFMLLNFFRNYVPAAMSGHFDPFSRKTIQYFIEGMHDLATWAANPDPFSGNIMWELSRVGVSVMGQAQLDAKVIQKSLTRELINEARATQHGNIFEFYRWLTLATQKSLDFARFWADSGDSIWKIVTYRSAKDWAMQKRDLTIPQAQEYAARVTDESFVNFEHPSIASNFIRKTPILNAMQMFFTARLESARNRGMQTLQILRSPFTNDKYRVFRVLRGLIPLAGLLGPASWMILRARGAKTEDLETAPKMRTHTEQSAYGAATMAPWSGYDENGNFKADFIDLTSGIEEFQLLRNNPTLPLHARILANWADSVTSGDGSFTAMVSDYAHQIDPTIDPGYRRMSGLPPAGEKSAAYLLFNGMYRGGGVPRIIPMSMDILKKSKMLGNELPETQEQWGPAATAVGLTTGLMREPVTVAPNSPTDLANMQYTKAQIAKNRGILSREKHEYRNRAVELDDAVRASEMAKEAQKAAGDRYLEKAPKQEPRRRRRKQ